jgi:hypothetical protein
MPPAVSDGQHERQPGQLHRSDPLGDLGAKCSDLFSVRDIAAERQRLAVSLLSRCAND